MGQIFRCARNPVPAERLDPCPDCSTLWTCRSEVQEIALVDDDPDQVWELADALRTEKRRIHVFLNAMDTIRHLVSRACDVLLSDIDMPGMNGLELASWVARECPRTRIILISGRVPNPTLQKPGWTFLPKPVSLSRLDAVLQA